VVLVEGDAENILLPVFAKCLGRSFTEYGVSVVNVGSRGLFRYGRIFQRNDGQLAPVKVACVADRDITPDAAKAYAPKTQRQVANNLPKYESELIAAQKIETQIASIKKYDGGVVKTFVSEKWTLEHDIALAGYGEEMHVAICFAKKLSNAVKELNGEERKEVFREAKAEYQEWAKTESKQSLAARVYEPLYEKEVSKALTAQIFAAIIISKKQSPLGICKSLPPYLVAAIEYVTEALPAPKADA